MIEHTEQAADISSLMEDVYPLSPMQLGIVFHVLFSPDSGAYLNQYVFSLRGKPDPVVLREAWQHVLDQRPVLRTAFVWEEVEHAVQVVFRRAVLPWESCDWRGHPAEEQQERLNLHLESQRRPFDLLRPPLMRVSLIRRAEEEFDLVWSFHHLVLDGWSLSLVLQDVLTSYDALLRRTVPVLPRRRPYHDYIAWLLRQDLAAAEAYWRGALAGLASPTPLGVDRAPEAAPAEQAAFGTTERLLPTDATEGLQAFARQHKLTVNTLVQGAWGLLLSRYAGEEDVVFGAVVTGRPPELVGMEAMVGLFVNTIPVRVRVESGTRVDEWLRGLQAQQLEARRYEYTPLSQVLRWSGVPAGAPLFESIVAFENHPIEEMDGGDSRGFAVAGWSRSSQGHYPLALVVLPGKRMSLQVEYDAGRIGAGAAQGMANHLETVLEAVVADPARRLSELSLLRGAERAQVLEAWSAHRGRISPRLPHPRADRGAGRAHARTRRPCSSARRSLTYAELESGSNRLAHHLRRARAWAPETRVGICLERGVEMVVAVLAVLKAGGAYVPLDPAHPAERLARRARRCGRVRAGDARAVAERGSRRSRARSSAWTATPRRSRANPARRCRAGADAARLPPTSSTPPAPPARPKGVVVEHGSLAQLRCRPCGGAFGPRPGTWRWRWRASPSTSGCSRSWCRWSAGRGAPAAAGADTATRAAWWRSCAPRGCSHAVPALMRQIVAAARRAGPRRRGRDAPGVLRRRGGDARPAAGDARGFPQARLCVLYGPTETTVLSTSYVVRRARVPGRWADDRAAAGERAAVRAGRRGGAGCRWGCRGSCTWAARGGARLPGRPELTAERFVPDPFGGGAGARLYRTGDRVRWLRRRGAGVPGADWTRRSRCAASASSRARSRRRCWSCRGCGRRWWWCGRTRRGRGAWWPTWCPRTERECSAPELRERLAARLPEYMVPARSWCWSALPLNANGKLDRRALPAPERRRRGAVRGAAERRRRRCWRGSGRRCWEWSGWGWRTSFFELGGHSLLATQVVSRARQAFGVEVPLRALFEAPTVAGLAGRIEALRGAGRRAAPPIERVPREGPLPLSFAQQRLWLVDRLEPGSAAYNMPFALRLRGALDARGAAGEPGRAGAAARDAAHHVRGARTAGPCRWSTAPRRCRCRVLDLRGLPDAERGAARRSGWPPRRRCARSTWRAGRCCGARCCAWARRTTCCSSRCTTSSATAGACEVLVREVSALYAAFSRGEEPPLPELPVQYADFAVWQREWLSGEVLEAQVGYWRERAGRRAAAAGDPHGPPARGRGRARARGATASPSRRSCRGSCGRSRGARARRCS